MAGVRHQDQHNQRVEAAGYSVDTSKGQREKVRTERETFNGPKEPNEPQSRKRESLKCMQFPRA